MLRIDIITIFPELLESFFNYGVIGRGLKKGLFEIRGIQLRDFTDDPHRTVDDYPFGGGAGMVMKAEPLFKAVESVKMPESQVILMTPQGERFNHKIAKELSKGTHFIMVCGRYEGIDERFREEMVDIELSIGDYVLSGGELPALVVLDSVLRFLPGILNKEESHLNDSFEHGLLDYPVYTRPREFRGVSVPEILLSGNHKQIEDWRKEAAKNKTRRSRPDLLEEK
ncbi:MAG TPA: tRNA (guanosine(37)-N1)-methyltransferase TrmD [Firmicutes bacterium]|nr:tRNA (guanosine(37)-N1)-methyltransferase TrmD [Bacillota bacterium]